MTVTQTKEITNWADLDQSLPVIATKAGGTLRVEGPIVAINTTSGWASLGVGGSVIRVDSTWQVFQEIPTPPLPTDPGSIVRVWWVHGGDAPEQMMRVTTGDDGWVKIDNGGGLWPCEYRLGYLERNVAAWEWVLRPASVVLPQVADEALSAVLKIYDAGVMDKRDEDGTVILTEDDVVPLRNALANAMKPIRSAR
jgi:hypothetical protein